MKREKIIKGQLDELVKKFSKNNVIDEIEKEFQALASRNLALSTIDDNSFVKRASFPPEVIERLALSVKEKGLWSPLVVRPSGSHYELILGRKRYFAAKKAGLSEAPCVIADVGDEEMLLMLLADTRDQRDSNIVEMALVYEALSERFNYSQATLGNLAHESRCQVTNTMRILGLPDHIINELSIGKLSYGHAKAIASLSDEEIEHIVSLIHSEHLSVRQTEELAKQYSQVPSLFPKESENLKKACGAANVLVKKESIVFTFQDEKTKEDFIDSCLSFSKK
jgi:ParB family chromosome partitioning protein